MPKLKLSIFALAVSLGAGVASAKDPLHQFGRKQDVDLRTMKLYDSQGVAHLGKQCSSTHSLASGDSIVCGKLEVPAAAGPTYVDAQTLFSKDPNGTAGAYREAMLSHTTGVNWNVSTKTAVFTCPSTVSKCYVTKAVLKNGSATSGTAACGLGFDASGVNVHASATHALTTSTYMVLSPVAVAAFGNPNDVLGWKCATPEGAAYTSDVDVFGFVE